MKKNEKLNSILKELFRVRNPHISRIPTSNELEELSKKIKDESNVSKVGLPISKKSFLDLITSRNRNLIYPHEQKRLQDTTVAFFGMSVGASALLSWMMLSRAQNVKIADPDTIDATNLNRLLFGFEDIGRKKTEALKELVLKINPFVNVSDFPEKGIEVINEIMNKNPRVNIIVDEIDDIEAKIYLRKVAKKQKLPLVSAADVGDMTMLDIERYDVDKDAEPFLGRLGDVEKIDFSNMSDFDRKKLIIKLVGFENNSERMLESLMSIGGSITTWPQLGPTAYITGGVVGLTIKKIILGENIKSGRYYISMDNILVHGFDNKRRKSRRQEMVDVLRKLLKI